MDKESKTETVAMFYNRLSPPDRLVLKFEPGTSVAHIKEWVSYYVRQAQTSNKQSIVSADSMHVSADGAVVITGRNIGLAGQAAGHSSGKGRVTIGKAFNGGDVMDGVDSFQVPRPPRPKIPGPDELNGILTKLVSQPVLLQNVAKSR